MSIVVSLLMCSISLNMASRDVFLFVFHDTATTEIYTYIHTLSLHDALPILLGPGKENAAARGGPRFLRWMTALVSGLSLVAIVWNGLPVLLDRKSTRLNSSH